MKKQLSIALFFLLSVTMIAQNSNNKYQAQWKLVETSENNNLPQSAAKEVDKILQQAIADKNNTQVIKALVYKNKLKAEINSKDNEAIFADLGKLAAETNNACEKSLLNSMLAELYLRYYQNDQWRINQRTKLVDNVPEDIKEWSSNIFKDKIVEYLNLSVKDVATLKAHTTKEYDDIILLGDDAKSFYPTLYDFVMERGITLLQGVNSIGREEFDIAVTGVTIDQLAQPANEYTKLNIKAAVDNSMLIFVYYQQYLKDLLSRNLIPTIILTEINKIEYLKAKSRNFNAKALDAYLALEKRYRDNETTVEIIDKITDSYNQNYGAKTTDTNKNIYDWLKAGIEKYPNYKRIGILKNKLIDLEDPEIMINGKSLLYPNTDVTVDIIHKNIQLIGGKAVFRLYKIESKSRYSLAKEYSIDLKSKDTYNVDTLKFNLGSLPYGKYSFSYISKKKLQKANFSTSKDLNDEHIFTVSSLMAISRNSAKDEYEIIVLDRNLGKPIKDATVEIYESNYDTETPKLITTLKTNDLGIAIYKDNRQKKDYYYNVADYKVTLGADAYLEKEALQNQDYRWRDNKQSPAAQTISVFTDRSIYRPGQTVYFKAIVLNPESKPIANKYFVAKLYNANNEVVSEKKIFSNEYGSIADNFTLPQSGRLGQYRVDVEGTSSYFRVEEYKRPTFEVTFDKLAKTYTFGEEVTVKGYAKNFSGVNLQDADVKYNISREQYSFWYWRSSNASHFTDGTVKTKDDGSFEISFTPEAGDGNNYLFRGDRQVYTFKITATVTDVNGETQTNTYNVTVGNVSMVINVEMPDKIEKSDDYKIKIGAKNLQGEDIETSGTYTISLLDDKSEILNKVLEGSFKTGEQPELKDKLKNLTSGRYRLQIKALDDKKNEVSEETDFIIYSYNDKKPPIKTNAWLVQKNTTFTNDGKPVEIIYGASDRDIYVLYQLYNNKTIFERRFVKISEANELFKVPYKAEYGDQIYMSLTSVKDGNFYNEDILLTKEADAIDAKLDVKLEVFRDKLRPGQEETWTISIKDSKSKPVVAELLASMYDSSLDKLYPYTAWALNRPYIYKEYLNPIGYSYTNSHLYDGSYAGQSIDYDRKRETIKNLSFDRINWFGYIPDYMSYGGYFDGFLAESVVVTGVNQRTKSTSGMLQGKIAGLAVADTAGDAKFVPPTIVNDEEAKINENGDNLGAAPQIRRNFNETAFFFPQLRTNEKGETLVSFTVPENNTTWRFRALAHDKNARVGTLEQMVVTRKELMVTPNMPRFVRQGDKTSISTKISNLSDKAISGDVRIEFFDPLTDKAINLNIANQKQSFSAEKDASTSASWTFDVPNDIELIGCRIVAQNATFSDGEQHTLAVLSNRMLVTESMPIDITKAGTSTFTFDKLKNNNSSTLTNYNLTLEYASNPAWYAIQALPTMSNPSSDNAVSWFASYYVNTLGASIMRQYPKVAAMIEAWKKQAGDKETLISKLQKNEELKAVLLEETPWVLDAKDENEQMQKLSLLFDLNNTKQLTDAATQKLAELVTDKGGWSWYKGMYPSRSVTQYILYGYANLQRVGKVEYPQQIKELQIKALNYIDKQIAEDFANLKKYDKDWQKLSSIYTGQLEYLYVRSSYRDIPISKEAREAERFYTSVVSTNWTKIGLYERSLLAVLAKRNGDKVLADKLTKSIAEYTRKDAKQGMYWPNNRANVFMSMSSISTHVFLMEALQENGASVEDMDMMKRWLINQKRTQVWESTHASIDAISALLSSGSDWFAEATAPTTILVGGKKVEPEKKEEGTGYFKTSWSKTEISNNMAKVEVTTPDSKPAYGALYWQYYENLDKVTLHKGEELNVDKQLYKEETTATGKGLKQITENNPLTVGDKVIVRLTIRADRDMEFVHLKDMRAPCFEPQENLSGLKWRDMLMYYQTTKDASTNFYFDRMPKGTYVLEYPVFVNRSGVYANGITSIQCMYAPEYVSHTTGITVTVKDK